MKLLWTFSLLPALAAAAGYNPSTTFPGQSTQNGSFINPDNGITSPSDYAYNKVYEVGSQLNISWDASFSPVDLLLCAPGLNGEFAYNKLQHNTSESSYNWAVSNNPVTGTGLVADNLFFMLVNWQGDDGSTYFTSHFFNISNSSTTPATTTLANPSAMLAPTATSAFPAASSTTAAAGSNGDASAGSDQSTNNSSKGVSGGAAAGIVIGVLAAVGIGAAAVWRFFWLPRRRRATGGIIGVAGRGDGRGPGAGPMAELENQGGYVAAAGASAGAAEAIVAEYKSDMSGSNLSTWSKSTSTILVSSPQHQHEAQHQDQQLQQPQKQYIYEVAASPVTAQHPMGAPGELPA